MNAAQLQTAGMGKRFIIGSFGAGFENCSQTLDTLNDFSLGAIGIIQTKGIFVCAVREEGARNKATIKAVFFSIPNLSIQQSEPQTIHLAVKKPTPRKVFLHCLKHGTSGTVHPLQLLYVGFQIKMLQNLIYTQLCCNSGM